MYKVEIFTDQLEYASACMIDDVDIELDYLAYDSYTITTPSKTCQKGYFVHITDEDNNYIADGIVGDVQPNDTMQDIQLRPLQTLFDSEVFYTPVHDAPTWLATNIDEAFMHNTDTLQNRPVALTYTTATENLPLTGYNLHETVNILSVMISALKTYGVVVDCRLNLTEKKFEVDIFPQEATKVLEADLDNVLEKSVTIGDSYGSTNKAIIRKTQIVDDSTTVLGQTEYYLHPDGSIDTSNTNRIIPVFYEIESLALEDDMTEADWQSSALGRAKEILTPAKYDNEIDLTYAIDDQLAHPMELAIGTATTIYLEGEAYSSILTGKRIHDKEVTLIFGVTRAELSKKLSLEKRETMTFENTVSAVMSNVAPNYVNNKTGIAPKARQLINYYPNTTRPTTADVPTTSETGLFTFLATASMTTNKPPFGDGTIITMPWDSTAGWTSQLFVRNSADKMPCLGYRFQYGDATKPWTAWNMLPFYRVGDVVVTSTANANLNGSFGGTWELIDKEFTDWAGNSTTNGTYFTINGTNVTSIAGCYCWRSGHTLRIELRLNLKVALTDSTIALGTLKLANLGVSSLGRSNYLIGQSDGGNGLAMIVIGTNGSASSYDVVTKASNGTIPAGSRLDMDLLYPLSKGAMLDSACDKFYWKRTA